MIDADWAKRILAEAELIHSAETVLAAVDRIARDVTRDLADHTPLVLTVMGGAVVFAGHLLTRLHFPLEADYIHATRYGTRLTGAELNWIAAPRVPVQGRHVLVCDDILDEGHTLAAIRIRLLEDGARTVRLAVLADKQLPRPKPVSGDYVGLLVPDRYVFGFGMDAAGAWRNLPSIHAMAQEPSAA